MSSVASYREPKPCTDLRDNGDTTSPTFERRRATAPGSVAMRLVAATHGYRSLCRRDACPEVMHAKVNDPIIDILAAEMRV